MNILSNISKYYSFILINKDFSSVDKKKILPLITTLSDEQLFIIVVIMIEFRNYVNLMFDYMLLISKYSTISL